MIIVSFVFIYFLIIEDKYINSVCVCVCVLQLKSSSYKILLYEVFKFLQFVECNFLNCLDSDY